jgi:phytoene dehydrogenase-like protein
MPQSDNNIYDAIIIGAGMSGLVCGCYLALAGMKVLIAEQHHKPGGYCSTFKRKGFTFDAAAHSFGSYREGGNFKTVVKELGLDQRIVIRRYDPADIVVTPNHRISFWNDREKTIRELQIAFPHELKTREFISFMSDPKPADIAALRNQTFKEVLDRYFTDDKIKTILFCQLFGNGGLPPSLMSAFTGSKIFTEFVVDGGYYPDGGMQALPDAFAQRFTEFGGTLLLSSSVAIITEDHGKVSGVVLKNGTAIRSRCVISNCDARQTYLSLLKGYSLNRGFAEKLNTMRPSLSMFIAYIGIDEFFDALPQPGSTLWFLPHYDIEQMYLSAQNEHYTDLSKYLLRVSPSGKTILAMANTSFKNKEYWDKNKQLLLNNFIAIIEQTTVPDLSKHLRYQEAASPYTLYSYTLNYQGAAYGWESINQQFLDPDFRKPTFIDGLYLTGHWTTYAQGLAGVVYLGYDLAKSIIRKNKTVRA